MILTQAISRVVFFCRPHKKTLAFIRTAACVVLVSALPSLVLAENTVVRLEVSYGASTTGNIDIELYDDQAPITVANFLIYASLGYYASDSLFNGHSHNSFFHRSARVVSEDGTVVTPLTIRAGGYGYYYDPSELSLYDPVNPDQAIYEHIPQFSPIPNEFSPLRSNAQGTITMAKAAVDNPDPDSATSEWIINLADNGGAPLNFDTLNGGYAVFGRVIAGMEHAVAIGNLPNPTPPAVPTKQIDGFIVPGQFSNIPLINYDQGEMQPINLARVLRIPNVASTINNLGILEIFTADVNSVFDPNATKAVDSDKAYSLLKNVFKSPPDTDVQFNNGMITLSLSSTTGQAEQIVTIYDNAFMRPTNYYAYSKPLDDTTGTGQWYDFTFDGTTGAQIKSDRIILHFVDGMRGDNDGTVNGSISHVGIQAIVTPQSPSSTGSGGCTITTPSSQAWRSGDWALVSLFLAVLAIARKRARRN